MKTTESALSLEQHLGHATRDLRNALTSIHLNLGDCATHGDRPIHKIEREIGRHQVAEAIDLAEAALTQLRAARKILKYEPKSEG